MPSGTDDPLLAETLNQLRNHDSGSCSGLCTLKRLVHKATTGDAKGGASKVSIERIVSAREERTVKELRDLQRGNPKAHDRISDIVKTDKSAALNPIVIAAFDGKEYLIDGSNRINYWHENGDPAKKLLVNHHTLLPQMPSNKLR